MTRETLSPELALLAACCRWPPSPAREAAVRAAAEGVDWTQFARVVARHRVAALALDGLRRAGIEPPAAVSAEAAKAGLGALAMARETLSLQRAFGEAGLEPLFVKGSTLALIAYGALGMKQSWDIDLLVRPADVIAGRRLLEQLGYVLIEPEGLDEARFARFAALGKEAVFRNIATNITVELHWRLVDNPGLLGGLGEPPPAQQLPIGGETVATLADEALFAYLCAHGTAHGWARLKWLADVNAFLTRPGAPDVERLYREAIRLGAGRTPAVALLLCHRLLGLALPEPLLAELRADRVALRLERTSLACLAYRGGAEEFGYHSLPSLRVGLSHFALVPGPRYFGSELRHKWNSPTDRIRLPLPRPLGFLYHVIRIPMWFGRLGRHLAGRAAR
jgi:hypothetical protein